MVVGIVTLNALAVQATYHMQVFRQEVSDLSTQQVQLTDQAATLSAPGRVATWAREHGMQAPGPGNTVVLRVRGFAGSDSGRSAP
jgi:cell division protein FtsL